MIGYRQHVPDPVRSMDVFFFFFLFFSLPFNRLLFLFPFFFSEFFFIIIYGVFRGDSLIGRNVVGWVR